MADKEYAQEHAAEQYETTMSILRKHFEREQFEKALPLCIKALEMQPDCAVTRRCKVFTLLQLSRWMDALQACEKLACSEESFAYESAYCQYRLNKFEEALDALKKASSGDARRNKKLEAQIRYRMGDYDLCAKMYEELYEEDEEEQGFLVNAIASHVSGDNSLKAVRLMGDHEDLLESSYELNFNLGCAYLEQGKLGQAEACLDQARKICAEEIMEAEELDEEEAGNLEEHEELFAIDVQRACVMQRRGSEEDKQQAGAVYDRVMRQRAGQVDITVLAVASNNAVAMRSKGKLLDSLKRISIASKESLEHKLTKKQRLQIAINKALLLIQGSRLEEARKECAALAKEFPGDSNVALAQAALALRDKKGNKSADDVLQAFLAEHPGNEEVLACLAQFHQQANRREKAAEVLSQLSKDGRVKPQILEAVVTMHQRQKEPDKAVACLREAMTYWQEKEGAEEQLAQVLKVAGRVGEKLKDREFLADTYKTFLEAVDGSDAEALCGLVKALATSDPISAEGYAQRLNLPDYSQFDPEELEVSAVPKVAQILKAGGTGGEGDAEVKKKRKRKRKPKFDPANPGPPKDPERWLPKSQRTSFQKSLKKRDKQSKDYTRGAQGAMPADDQAFRKTGPSTAQIDLSKPDSSRPKGAAKRKGKK